MPHIRSRFRPVFAGLIVATASFAALAQVGVVGKVEKFDQEDKFRQLEEILPTPTSTRTASGAPGHAYWQQRADYVIDVTLDDERQTLTGTERITYHNHSPDTLTYLWLQLDQNYFSRRSDGQLSQPAPVFDGTGDRRTNFSYSNLRRILSLEEFPGGFEIHRVASSRGDSLDYTIVKTMMRIDLPRPLPPSENFEFEIDWTYHINNAKAIRARCGYEYFEEDGNFIYEIAQWFPRMAVYGDSTGWQHKQFLGRGEFTLELGDYTVRITAPDDHVVAATGVLQNAAEVLSAEQRDRFERAAASDEPMFVITPREALENETSEPSGTKTWVYQADNVRDFAFASSRKFIWDAMGVELDGGNRVMAMSYYPNEGEPLWSRYSTHAVAHTLEVVSRHTFDYPYPVAISVNGPVGGMEYPMLCFNGPRPEEDGTYSERTKYGLISVIIHEVVHNWFPMIINSDERQWTWMDEGLTTFCQFLAEQEWEHDYPSRRGEARNIVDFMKSANQVPIMTNSESLLQFGNNAYAKPATALNVLRETVMGRELFDFAFKEYANRWKFKKPMPADFFRTMEDASSVDLDWFWRGWFYSTDHVDIAIQRLHELTLTTHDPEIDKAWDRAERDARPRTMTQRRNEGMPRRTDRFPGLLDFYNDFDEHDVLPSDREAYEKLLDKLEPEERELLATRARLYAVDFENVGGLVMPIILEVSYDGGETELIRIPAEIWQRDNQRTRKLLVAERPIVGLRLDPYQETADVDETNNFWPPRPVRTRFELFKRPPRPNPMRELLSEDETSEDSRR